MMRMKCLTLLIVLTIGIATTGIASEEWFKGNIMLAEGEEIRGEIAFKPFEDLVLIKEKETIKTFPASKIYYFRFYDTDLNLERIFISLTEQENNGRHTFFEVMLKGPATLLRKEIRTFRSSHDPRLANRSRVEKVKDHDYLVSMHGSIFPFDNFKKHVLPLLAPYEGQLKAYVKQRD